MSGKIVTILWRDIPVQVTARDGKNVHRVSLPERFQVAIDRAAMDTGLVGTDAYLDEWRQTEEDCLGDVKVEAVELARRLDDEFPMATLNEYVKNGAFAPDLEEPS